MTDADIIKHARDRLRNENAIIEKIREHLREAARNQSVNKMTFEFEFNRGGVTKGWVDLEVRYRYLENGSAI